MVRFCSISSGSRGNAIFVSDGKTRIMIDCGISGAKLQKGLSLIDERCEDIDAVLITHEHNDHIGGVGVLHRMSGADIYANELTMAAAERSFGKVNPGCICTFDDDFSIGDISVMPFKTSHDSVRSVGYRLSVGGESVAVATDMGIVNDRTKKALLGCKNVLLESNHDINMLKNGPYPYKLKERILSEGGHLSNDDASVFACELVKNGCEKIVLGHLSEENNLVSLAYSKTNEAFLSEGIQTDKDVSLQVARLMAVKVIL